MSGKAQSLPKSSIVDDIYPLKFEKTYEATVQTLNRLIPAKPISQIFLQVHYNCYDYQWALEQFLKAFFVVLFSTNRFIFEVLYICYFRFTTDDAKPTFLKLGRRNSYSIFTNLKLYGTLILCISPMCMYLFRVTIETI